MRALAPSIITLLFFSLVQLVSAQSHLKRNSHEKRFPSSLQRRHTTHLAKRFNGAFTYYAVGVGACGATNQPSDFIVALNAAQYGSGGYCFAVITISYGGKSTQATIMDECPGCGDGGLDLSEGLFTFFAPTSQGVLQGTWVFGSSGDSQSTSTTSTWTSTPPPPTTTSTTSTTYTPPPTTSSTPTTTSTSTSTTTSSTSSSTPSSVPSSSPTPTTTSSSSSAPSSSPTPTGGPDVLDGLDTAISQLSAIVAQMVLIAG
ncbi:RlpA-like double-psi beta-barrel-protein domain-containing protein-containing protein [Lactarius quietus]|nr:RlpA-like double-psi beta-barrel-protein domain-containing protein-containing protein [Lactarius quietus]